MGFCRATSLLFEGAITPKMPRPPHNSIFRNFRTRNREAEGAVRELEKTLKAAREARRRKAELKNLLEILYQEYQLVKTEIKLHEQRIEKLMSAKEYTAYLDTIKMDTPLMFPDPSDHGAAKKK